MLNDESMQLFKQTIDQSQSIFIFVSSQVKFDQAASALALFQGLQQLGKDVSLISSASPKENLQGLTGVEKIVQQIGNKNLQVSFDYEPDMVDKVSYNIDEETKKFYLIIQPKKGTPPLNSQTVEFMYTGANVDLIITIGVTNLETLDGLYYGFESMFSETNIVSIHAFETEYGTLRLSTAGMASSSEMIAKLLQYIEAPINPEIASNLLAGLEMATDHLRSSSLTADTFEVIAQLLRAGGHRLPAAKMALPEKVGVSTNGFAQAMGKPKNNEDVRFKQASQDGGVEISKDQNNKNRNRKPSPPPVEMPRMEGGSRV